MTTDDLTCKELVEVVTDYLEGTLPPSEKERFEEHLGVCPGCRIHLQQMRQTIRTLGQLTEETIQPHVRDEFLRLFRQWKGSK